ncbi:ER degradation-enhancing alpha-mannosidase-like protein 3 isoform X2 [Ostrinia furnacalis]|uniref:ER degradation-enhancing alpha-mannosidase-like protein 3 isoform X1 n=1 Tax=Ostrinia furnacalis TaxID=93504 RepID=UPI00103D3E13|nr:ER degradation-enhancing alpha-mannosidase-like protein 3 isoform X1 [Ostrinia furnacalis]XP_028179122.1 ER degradation-enhancing alpha-mannosidase-like protein 3 isoform X2 [Ostrinia furnacalis]
MVIMAYRVVLLIFIFAICVSTEDEHTTSKMTKAERLMLREEARSMFYHAYDAYMYNAYPADELMPLSCKGRWKGITPSRGDMDDSLGNFSLTLVDSLDTLVVMGDFSEFNNAIKLVIKDVTFDHDIIVSVFETNIRMLGGLLSAHVLADALKPEIPILQWYNGELLAMAEDLGKRLLPAFNTSTGIPHGRINLRHGIRGLSESRETCTACAGTMILEMAALSRLTGNLIYEQKAHKAMDRLWKIRHRTSDLMGTVINIHSGDWVRKDSGVGAGIDSYYEYCLKAYILLGDEKYLARFTRHYNAVMKYISRGPVMLAVHMHRPHLQSRNFMDALLAFWPGLQVLLGDVRPAVETHEMLYQVMQRHTFIPEAFTTDFQVHWGQHPLRPEFLESTYFLHRATGDDHYLRVGRAVLKALQQFARVPCGYAAVNDVRTRLHEDRMDSFVLAETFKYLYMLFGEDKDLPVKLEDYVLTTEAHFLPLSLAAAGKNTTYFTLKIDDEDEDKFRKTCPNTASLVPEKVRQPMRQLLGSTAARPPARLRPLNDPRQVLALADMGISVLTLPDGRVQLLYTTSTAKSAKDAAEGLTFMREMSKWNSMSDTDNGVVAAGVKVNDRIFPAGPGHFGRELGDARLSGRLAFTVPSDACAEIQNPADVRDLFAVAKRGQCTFAQKVRNIQSAGAKLAIILDNIPDSTHEITALFAMSGDGKDDIHIPAVFLYSKEAEYLTEVLYSNPELTVIVGDLKSLKREFEGEQCDGGNCEAVIESTDVSADKESFDHLKKVLNQLVAQFELSLSNEDQVRQKKSNDDLDLFFAKSKEKFINNKARTENTPACTANSEPANQIRTQPSSEDKKKDALPDKTPGDF